MRIRNLENEISYLQTENLGLREEMLRLQNDSESKRSRHIVEHLDSVKTDLQMKLLEIGALITSIGDEPPKPPKQATSSTKPVRERYSANGSVEVEEGRLPAIQEDKQYPRRTLEQVLYIGVGGVKR
jgi:hypothetical protein